MSFELSIYKSTSLIHKQAVDQVLDCNYQTSCFGLSLTQEQATALVETRTQALKANGRIEFGSGIIDKLILAFCDSPYLSRGNYEETLHELLDAFYYYKNETLDSISDDELIQFMKESFDGPCEGSTELLIGRELDAFARAVREGGDPLHQPVLPEPDNDGDSDDEEEKFDE